MSYHNLNHNPNPNHSQNGRGGTFPLNTRNPSFASQDINYNSVHHRLEDENSRLMDQRKEIEYRPSSYGQGRAKKSYYESKIQEVAGLCREDHREGQQALERVYAAEEEIYRRMQMVDTEDHYQNIPSLYLDSMVDDRGTTFGPKRHPTNPSKTRSHIPSQQPTQRSVTPTPNPKQSYPYPSNNNNNKYKKSAIDGLKTQRNNNNNNNETERDQTDNDNYVTSPRVHQYYTATPMQRNTTTEIGDLDLKFGGISDDYIGMIQAIERKAMQEIECLRADKIQLMKKLNNEIRAHNREKKLRIMFEEHLKKIKGGNEIIDAVYASMEGEDSIPVTQQPYNQKKSPLNFNFNSNPNSNKNNINPFKQQINPNITNPKNSHRHHPSSTSIKNNHNNNNNSINNQNLKNNNNNSNSNKEELLREIDNLNQKIGSYQNQIRYLQENGKDSDQARALLEQGEAIRQETLRLLRLQGYNVDQYDLQELRNRMKEEQEGKSSFLNDLATYKKKLSDLEEENERLRHTLSRGVSQAYREIIPDRKPSFPANQRAPQRSNETISSRYYSINKNYQNDAEGTNRRNSQSRMQEFEQLIGDIRRAAR